MKKMIGLLILGYAFASSSFAAGLSPEDLIGDYSGDKGCIIQIKDYPGNMLEISLIKKGYLQTVEYLAKYRVETISDDGDFSIEQEYFGFAGEETKEFSGKVKNSRLEDLKLERRQSAFTSEAYECKNMVRIRN